MSIKDCYQMRKRRSLDKTPGRSTSNDGRFRTPRRITSNHSLAEQGLDVVWDNNSPSPSRTLMLGKRKKHVGTGSDSSSSGGEISDLVKKLADKSGQTPTNNSLLNYWLEEESHQSNDSGDKCDNQKVKSTSKKKSQVKTPCRRPRELRKSRQNKKKLSKELEMLASMIQDSNSENIGDNTSISKSTTKPSTSIVLIPINSDNTSRPPYTCSKDNANADTRPSITATKVTSPPLASADDFDEINWDDDKEGDDILSQVDISALYNDQTEDQVFTNTPLFNVQSCAHLTPDCKDKKGIKDNIDCNEPSFVTESWDFDDDLEDEDNLVQTLEEVERAQIISNIPSNPQNTVCKEKMTILDVKKPKTEPLKSKPLYSKEEIERKKLQAQLKLKQKQKQKSLSKQHEQVKKTIDFNCSVKPIL